MIWRRRWIVLLVPGALAAALVALVGLVSATNGGASDIVVADAWARSAVAASAGEMPGMNHNIAGTMAGGSNSVVYLTITNRGAGRDRLIGATADVAEAVELHHTAIDDNVASMRLVESVEVPGRGEVRFSPGGYHLVLVRLSRGLRPGDIVTLHLTFEHAGSVAVAARVRES